MTPLDLLFGIGCAFTGIIFKEIFDKVLYRLDHPYKWECKRCHFQVEASEERIIMRVRALHLKGAHHEQP